MPNSEEISAKDALEMIIRGQIGELLFRHVKAEPEKAREEPVFTCSPTATVSIETGPVQVRKGEAIAVKFVDGKATVDVKRKDPEPSLDEGNRVTVRLPSGETIRKGQCVSYRPVKSLRDKVDARVSATVMGGLQMADPKDWFFALIDVLDEERSQSGQSRPVGKDRWIE